MHVHCRILASRSRKYTTRATMFRIGKEIVSNFSTNLNFRLLKAEVEESSARGDY